MKKVGVILLILVFSAGLAYGTYYYFYKSNVSASVSSKNLKVSRTVFVATVLSDFNPSKSKIITARIEEGNVNDKNKLVYIQAKESSASFLTPSTVNLGFYDYLSFGLNSRISKRKKIMVTGEKISGLGFTVVAADSVTLLGKSSRKSAQPSSRETKGEAFKVAIRGVVKEVVDYYNVKVKVTDGSIGFSEINLSPIWEISSVDKLKVGDEILAGLNYSRLTLRDDGSWSEGSVGIADVVERIGGE